MPDLPRYFRQITEPYRGKNDQMQVIGLCRFLYPALGGFQREHETIEQRKAFLYDEARLKHRLRLFQAFNLPSILALTDMDFQYLILIGDDLPVWARSRLDDLTAAADHIKNPAISPASTSPDCGASHPGSCGRNTYTFNSVSFR